MPSCLARAVKTVTESARERETFRYYSSLLSTVRYCTDGEPIPSSELVTSHDIILTALAQLGACQTGTSRALISLFDQEYQYIIAEATPNLPLVPNLRHKDQNGEHLWLCGTAIPRAHGACEHTLCAEDPASLDSNIPTRLPVVCVNNLHTDDRFASKPYCRPGSPAKFYAAVPIRSRRGINIGVFCVLHTAPIEWGHRHTDVMRNLSRTIMERLEATRSKTANRRSERMNRGLGSFVEGKATVTGWKFGPNAAAYKDNIRFEGALNAHQQVLHQRDESLSASTDHQHDAATAGTFPFPNMVPVVGTSHFAVDVPVPTTTRRFSQSTTSSGQPTIHDIFSKAANIIRESIEVEGCLFLDAGVGSFGPPGNDTPGNDKNRKDSQSDGSGSSDDGRYSSHDESSQPSCKVLGFSTTDSSSIDGARSSARHGAMHEKFLNGLLRRYPKGRIFSFDAAGELQSSDSSEDASSVSSQPAMSPGEAPQPPALAPPTPASSERDVTPGGRHHDKPAGMGSEGAHLLALFPGARSVAFVPVWDTRKERWCAGGFVYTHTPTRVFTTEGELSYMRAFGMLAMAETLRCETLLSEKAKTDALSSLSHEMRSPLHGIVLGAELMRDTDLTVFQGNVTHTIETCCRTLIDTVDHLLDYSKINNFQATKRRQKHATAPRGLRTGSTKSIQAGMKSLSSNVRLDALAEEVIESVFAGFNFQHISIAQLSKQRTTINADISANRQMDAMRAMEDLDPSRMASGEVQLTFGDASIFLLIDPSCSWAFYTQPGAVRRIIMNLFGNSLKHTQKGTIRVVLKQTLSKSKLRNNTRLVNIIVADTGRGISQDYLRNDLFKPFSQEDPLAPGSGLGLSIVKQITSQLRGRITVTSVVGVGTTVSVTLPLVSSSPETKLIMSDEEVEFCKQVKQLRGLRIRLLGFDENRTMESDESDSIIDDAELNGHRLIRGICRDWLHMEVISGLQAEHLAPDLILWSEDALPHGSAPDETLTKPPCIVVCANALVAYQRSTAPASVGRSGVFEFISQPVGPRKLAKILLLALDRWIAKQVILPVPDEVLAGPPRTVSPGFGVVVDAPKLGTPIISNMPLPPSPPPAQAAPGRGGASSAPWPLNAPLSLRALTSPPTPDLTPPMAPAPAAAPPPPANPKQRQQQQQTEFLLVDDNPINLKILSSYLHKLGLAYQTATNGREALDVYKRDPAQCKCIFMDISMPVMDGFEATRLIRAHEAELGGGGGVLPPASIFALSGLASSSAQQEAFWSGVDLFLTKPVKLKELGSILRSRGMLKAA